MKIQRGIEDLGFGHLVAEQRKPDRTLRHEAQDQRRVMPGGICFSTVCDIVDLRQPALCSRSLKKS